MSKNQKVVKVVIFGFSVTVNEQTITVASVVFYSGEKPFADSDKSENLSLLSRKTYGNGVILSKYEIEKKTSQ